MNNQLPMFISSMTPHLPVTCASYELRNPMSHLQTIKQLCLKFNTLLSYTPTI